MVRTFSIRKVIGGFMILLFLVVFNSHGKSYQRKPKSGSPDPTLSIQGKQKKKLKKINRKVNKKKAAAAKKSTRDTN